MDILGQAASKIDLFMLVLARVGGIFLIGPIFSNRSIPGQTRALLSVAVSLVLFTGLQLKAPELHYELGSLVLMIISEMMVGLIIGFVAQFVFAAIQFAGQTIDIVMGFSIVNVIDPTSGGTASLIGTFKNLFAMLIFLTTDSHHFLIVALYRSYDKIPITGGRLSNGAVEMLIDMFGTMLVTGIKIGIPIVGAIFVAEVATGLIARTMPQMQIFYVSMPVKIFTGFVLLLLIMPIYVISLQYLFEGSFEDTLKIFKLLT